MKKFISLVLALVMALSLTTIAWGAGVDCSTTCSDPTNHVAAVGTTHYTDLQEAVTAAASDASKTVTMLKDVTVATTLVVNGITLDGNGKTLIAAAALGGMEETTGVTYTDDMATIRTTGGTIKNLTVKGGWKGILYKAPATDLLLEKVTVVESARGLNVTGASASAKLTVKNSTLGGWISAESLAAVVFENTTFVANASGRGNGLNPRSNTTLTNCTANAGVKLVTEDLESAEAITVDGGTYTCDLVKDGDGTFVVKAGTFTDDVVSYLANGSVYKDGVVVKQSSAPTTGTTSTGTVTSGTVTPSKPTLYKLAAVGGSMEKVKDTFTSIKLTTVSGKIDADVVKYVPNIYNLDGDLYIQVAKAAAEYALYNNGAWIYLFRTPYGSDADVITAYATSVVMDKLVVPADDEIDCGDCIKGGALASYYVSGESVYYAGGYTWAYFNGEFVKYDKDTKVAFKDHEWDATSIKVKATDVKGTKVPVSIECSECEKTFSIVGKTAFDNTWVKGVNYTTFGAVDAYGQYYIVLTSATDANTPVVTPSTDKVTSAETFDAGIAMYVGMSVMAAAGSAVVLKKKD